MAFNSILYYWMGSEESGWAGIRREYSHGSAGTKNKWSIFNIV